MQMADGEAPVWLNIIVVRTYDNGLPLKIIIIKDKKIVNFKNCDNKH